VDEQSTNVLREIAAKRALTTKSPLSGRPWEDAVEAFLTARARYAGDVIERTTNAIGQSQRLTGDFILTVNPTDVRNLPDVRVVVESKRRAKAFTVREIRDELVLGMKKNRNALTGVFVVPSASLLPGAEPFLDVSPTCFAVTYDNQAGDETAFIMAIRITRVFAISAARKQGGGNFDMDKAMRLMAEVRAGMAYREQLRKEHTGAANHIANAVSISDTMAGAVLQAVSKLEVVLTA
jgi:hypothetical protein